MSNHPISNTRIIYHPETFRLISYCAFWLMVVVGVIVTNTTVDEDLSNSALVQVFGYNNICIYWDYTPAREIAAMVYPIAEYTMLGYIISSYIHVRASYDEGRVSKRFLLIERILLFVEILLLSWFRMVFVIESTVDTMLGHTLGFSCLQLLLCIIAIKNVLYFYKLERDPVASIQQKLGCGQLLTTKNQYIIASTYVIILIGVSLFKFVYVMSIFNGSPIIDPKSHTGSTFAKCADICWLCLAAMIPPIVAYFRHTNSDNLHISIRVGTHQIVNNSEDV